jgi:hypothetical protein
MAIQIRVAAGGRSRLLIGSSRRRPTSLLRHVGKWSRGVARWVREASRVQPFRNWGVSSSPMLRFHTPLIKPDGRISRIRLPDKKFTRSPTGGCACARSGE